MQPAQLGRPGVIAPEHQPRKILLSTLRFLTGFDHAARRH
jgi:hypothetical protein